MSKKKTLKTISDFTPQVKNANKHTQRGLGELQSSIQQDGWVGALTAASDGEIFDGSARIEVGVDSGFEDAIIVDSDGSKPVIIRRTDISNADDAKAKRLGIAANRVAEINLEWDAEVLASLADDGVEFGDLWSGEELTELLDDTEALTNEEFGKDFETKLEEFLDSSGGKIVLSFDKADFSEAVSTLANAREAFKVESNSEAALEVLRAWKT